MENPYEITGKYTQVLSNGWQYVLKLESFGQNDRKFFLTEVRELFFEIVKCEEFKTSSTDIYAKYYI